MVTSAILSNITNLDVAVKWAQIAGAFIAGLALMFAILKSSTYRKKVVINPVPWSSHRTKNNIHSDLHVYIALNVTNYSIAPIYIQEAKIIIKNSNSAAIKNGSYYSDLGNKILKQADTERFEIEIIYLKDIIEGLSKCKLKIVIKEQSGKIFRLHRKFDLDLTGDFDNKPDYYKLYK